MKVELSKREIEVIINLMKAGVTFLVTHTWADMPYKEDKEIINIKDLMEKLKEALTNKTNE